MENNEKFISVYKPTCLGPTTAMLRMFPREELLNSKNVLNVLEKAREAENKQLLEKMQKAMAESFAINPDKLFCTRGDITATESMKKMHDDSLDALAYSQHVYTMLVGIPVRRPEPTQKVYICEGLDKIYITGQNLERKLRVTKGKARRKIRRQLKKFNKSEIEYKTLEV